MKNKLKEKKWYANAVAACIAVTLYVVLTHLGTIAGGISTFLGYFEAVILGFVLAYLMNQLAKFFNRTILGRVPNETLRWTASVALTFIMTLLLLGVLLRMIIPQMVESIYTLVSNMDNYLASLDTLLAKYGLDDNLNIESYMDALFGHDGKVTTYLMNNINNILNASAVAGTTVVKWLVAFILSVYMLMAKDSMKRGSLRLLHVCLSDKHYNSTIKFLSRCDNILSNYIVFTLLDAAIVGTINAVFMAIVGMEYVGLVSLIVAITNLIPTFGPVIGAVAGGFILLLVNPTDALIFIVFTVVLQLLDGYIIKPKLFGDKLGVSGLLILAAIIVCGNIWGVVGILIAIPLAAILDFVFNDELLPALERRRAKAAAFSKGQETDS